MATTPVLSDAEMDALLTSLGIPELPPEIRKLAEEADEATVWHSVTGQLLLVCSDMLSIIQDSGSRDPRMLNVFGRYAAIARLVTTVRKPNTRFSAALEARREGGVK